MRKRKVRFLSIRQKFMLIAAICIVVVSVSIGAISYSTMERELLMMAADKAQSIGVLAGQQLDMEEITKLVPGDEHLGVYTEMRELLYEIKESSNVQYMYTLYTDGVMNL